MALAAGVKAELAQAELPNDSQVRHMLTRWMSATGWNDAAVAECCMKPNGEQYSLVTINQFRNGIYGRNHFTAENARHLCAQLVQLMQANPAAQTRRAQGRTYRTDSYKQIRTAFLAAVNKGWAYGVDGPPGSQKTHMLLALRQEIEIRDAGKNGSARRVLYVRCRPRMSRTDLLAEICAEAGIGVGRGSGIGPAMRKLRHSFGGHRVLLILDEAQHLEDDALETIRELLDEPPYIGMILAGSHDISAKLNSAYMEQWRSRLQSIIELHGLTDEEIREIATRELGPLSDKKVRELVEYCRVKDYRRRDAYYLSARKLFFFIEQAKNPTPDTDEDGDE